jgi:hypothetical protein
MSRSVWLRHDHERDDASNDQTIVIGSSIPSPVGARTSAARPFGSFSDLFRNHYRDIRTVLNAHTEPGLALFLASDEWLEASAWWPADERQINPLIVGRHSAAEVFVPSDARLSLRHLAIILHPHKDATKTRFRVLDLRTPTAFRDEEGRRLEAVEADGPLMLRCASFAALLFPTGGSEELWPQEAEGAWERVPERVHLECARAEPEWCRHRGGRRQHRGVLNLDQGAPTLSTSFPGPALAVQDLAGSDCPRGEIEVRSAGGRIALRLGETAARRGVLLGRYDRCDNFGAEVLTHERLSRVHLLLLEMAGALYAVDTASKNGVWQGPRRVRMARVEPGLTLALAHEALVTWHPFH